MKIAILGVGAMGLLYGGYLSRENEVYMLCRGSEKVDKINNFGVEIKESSGEVCVFHPKAVLVGSKDVPKLDVLILFTKSGASREALEENKHMISKETILLTLQNGSGHEVLLSEFASENQIAIGVTQDGSFLVSPYQIRHTGTYSTFFGMANGSDNQELAELAKTFNKCGFNTTKSEDVKRFIWEKLIINASSSVLSGILGMRQGYVFENEWAWETIRALVLEMVAVAKADGVEMDFEEQVARVKNLVTTNSEGVPSIVVDLKVGRKSEVDSISGSIVRAGKRLGIPTPTHNMAVNLVHAIEERGNAKEM